MNLLNILTETTKNAPKGFNIYELVGIAAGIVIFISFTFRKDLIIRSVNSVGCLLFVTYGILIGAHSVWVINGALFLFNLGNVIYALVKAKKQKSLPKEETITISKAEYDRLIALDTTETK